MMQKFRTLANGAVTLLLIGWVSSVLAIKGRGLLTQWEANKGVKQRAAADWKKLIDGRTPVLGTPTAKFKIVEFSDYQCPYCGKADPILAEFANSHPGDVAVYRYDLPLQPIHKFAYSASIAADCAELQGISEPYQSLLFRHQTEFATIDWTALAEKSGIRDIDAFATCIRKETPRDRIHGDIEVATSLAIEGTPTLFINGVRASDAVSAQSLESMYDKMHTD